MAEQGTSGQVITPQKKQTPAETKKALEKRKQLFDNFCKRSEGILKNPERDENDYKYLIELCCKRFEFNSDVTLLADVTQLITISCSANRRTYSQHKKKTLMHFVMAVHKVMQDRTWANFKEDGPYSNFLRYCSVLKTKPKRLLRYIFEAITKDILIEMEEDEEQDIEEHQEGKVTENKHVQV